MLAFAGCAKQVALDPARPDAVPTELRLEAPVTPLAGTVTMPRAAWGPFTQACKTRIITVSGPPVPVPDQVSQACARVQGDIRPDGSARITLSPPRLSPEQLAISMVRAPDGALAAVEASGSLLAQATPPERAALERLLPDAALAPRLPREVRQDTGFSLPVAGVPGVEGDLAVPCRVVGTSRLSGRLVVVADCEGTTAIDQPPNANGVTVKGTVSVAARLVADSETALTLSSVVTVTMPATLSNVRSGRSTETLMRQHEASWMR